MLAASERGLGAAVKLEALTAAAKSPRATGSLHSSHHAHTRSTVESLLTEGDEGYLSPMDDAFSVLSAEESPDLPSYYQVRGNMPLHVCQDMLCSADSHAWEQSCAGISQSVHNKLAQLPAATLADCR